MAGDDIVPHPTGTKEVFDRLANRGIATSTGSHPVRTLEHVGIRVGFHAGIHVEIHAKFTLGRRGD